MPTVSTEARSSPTRCSPRCSEIATEFSGSGRFWLTTIERSGRFMASGLTIGAGPVATFWIPGFDVAWSRLSPGTRLATAVIEHAAALGYEELDLGLGNQSYKLRISDCEEQLEMFDLERRERRPLHSPLRLMSYGARSTLKRRLKGRLGRTGGSGDPHSGADSAHADAD